MMLRRPGMRRAEPVADAMAGLLGGDAAPSRGETSGFRLARPADRLAAAATGGRMSRQFSAIILLEDDWEPDVEAVAATAGLRFPTIGRIEALPAPGPDAPGAVTIDGALVTLRQLPGPVPAELLAPPLMPVRSWDPAEAIRRQAGAVEIGCGGDLPGLEGAEAYAAAVHFVTTAACRVAPVSAVFWREGWALSDPADFADSAEGILAGRMPLGAWVSFAAIVPGDYDADEATGMVTYGLRPFIGRELELAPRPGSPRDAYRCVSRIARMALDRGLRLEDGQHLADRRAGFAVTVRERDFWLRRDLSAYVLVADDAVVEVDTLKPRPRVA